MALNDIEPDKIAPSDIEALCGEVETQHLEFKQAFDPSVSGKKELLKDIVGMANGGGGYIVVGAMDRDDRCTGFRNVENASRVAQTIRQIAADGVAERLVGLTVDVHKLSNGIEVVLIHVPESSFGPHMVRVDKHTDFWMRYQRDQRPMSIAEIKEAVLGDRTAMALQRLERGMDQLIQVVNDLTDNISHSRVPTSDSSEVATSPPADHRATILVDEPTARGFLAKQDAFAREQAGGHRVLRLAVTPTSAKTLLIDPGNEQVRKFLANPPEQRYGGWNMQTIGPVRRTQYGLNRGEAMYRELTLLWNGHMEFMTEIDDSFSWRQSPNEFQNNPLLYPYPVVEYPVTFARLASELYQLIGYQGNAILHMQYLNIRGCILRPNHPNTIGFSLQKSMFEGTEFLAAEVVGFPTSDDLACYKLISQLYGAFGYDEDAIPFFLKGRANIQ